MRKPDHMTYSKHVALSFQLGISDTLLLTFFKPLQVLLAAPTSIKSYSMEMGLLFIYPEQ